MTNDRRENKRLDNIKAYFVFEFRKYQVINISSGGLLAECLEGFDPDVLVKLRKDGFEFKLHDIVSNSELYFKGKVVRFFNASDSVKVTRIGVSFVPQGRPPITSRIVAVGGGKGGVGKTIVSINLAVALAKSGQKSVIILDGDFGNANCHTLLGITRLERSLENYFEKSMALEEVITPSSVPKVALIGGASNKIDHYLIQNGGKNRLLSDIRRLEANYIILDLGAGTGDDTLDLYNLASTKIVVMTPQYTSLQNAYSFVKAGYFRDLEGRGALGAFVADLNQDLPKIMARVNELPEGHPLRGEYEKFKKKQKFHIVANMIGEEKELSVIKNFQTVAKEFLSVESIIWGGLGQDPLVRASVNKMAPFVLQDGKNDCVKEMTKFARHLEIADI